MCTMKTNVYDTPDDLAAAAAQLWCDVARQAIGQHGRFVIALSGGTTPARLFRLMAQKEWASQIDWQNTYIFFGDERHVPHTHQDSNFLMARQTLLDEVTAPHIFPIPTSGNAQDDALLYQRTLYDVAGNPVTFDLIFLGLGGDGHTASLFPGTGAANVTNTDVTAVYLEDKDSWRISLTLPAINRAANVAFLVEGRNKAGIVQQILHEPHPEYPAQRVAPKGQLFWLLDKAAAGGASV